jgi:AraC family L-rhamnose operon regulatory protein RhaS
MKKASEANAPVDMNAGTTIGTEHFRDKRIPAKVLDERSPDQWTLAVQAPSRYKLILIHSGNAVLSFRDRETAIIAPAAVFVPHGTDATLSLGQPEPGDMMVLFHPCFVFDTLKLYYDLKDEPNPSTSYDGFMLYRFSPDRDPLERALFLEPSAYRFLHDTAKRMNGELERQPDELWPCRARSYLLEILIACTRLRESHAGLIIGEGATRDSRGLQGLYGYLIAHLGEKLTVDEIAGVFGTNRTSLQARVKETTGLSVAQYVINLRVQTASILLRNTSLPIAEIMDRTGFVDESHFSRIFRRLTGKTPSDFRKAFIFPSYVQ